MASRLATASSVQTIRRNSVVAARAGERRLASPGREPAADGTMAYQASGLRVRFRPRVGLGFSLWICGIEEGFVELHRGDRTTLQVGLKAPLLQRFQWRVEERQLQGCI